MINDEHMLWVERYRPHTIKDCILPEALKKPFEKYVENQEIPNLLLCGGPGVGKTTVARALCEEIGCDYIVINGSDESGIDTLRVKIKSYASSVSFTGGRKVVIIDEADYLNPNSTQPAFRGIIEEFAGNCTFIFTCNYKNRIIQPLHSRFAIVEFKLPNDMKAQMAGLFMKRVEHILSTEKVEYDKKVVAEVIMKHFPDYRRVLNELQRYATLGKIDSGIFAQGSDAKVDDCIKLLKEKDFKKLRKWVGENSSNDTAKIMREIYDKLYEITKPEFVPVAVVILGRYHYQAAFCSDLEINLMAFLTELMLEVEMKE